MFANLSYFLPFCHTKIGMVYILKRQLQIIISNNSKSEQL